MTEAGFRTVHRVVLPQDGDTDVLPLYVDFNPVQRIVHLSRREKRKGVISQTSAVPQAAPQRADFIVGRRSMRLPGFHRVSFGTYFNAFPASYWRNHSKVETVRLLVDVDAEASVFVYRSSPRGAASRVATLHTDGAGTASVDLPLAGFLDGGWYWFDLSSHGHEVTLRSAEWAVPETTGSAPGTLSIGVTTFNRPDYAVRHMRTLAGDADLMARLDALYLVDQGTDRVRDQPDFEEAARGLGDVLRLTEQGNIGGSGGFARGMHETMVAGKSRYVLLLDDDVSIETEGIQRALDFADFASRPVIVGGHMFNLYERSVLHTYGEEVDRFRFFWQPAVNTKEAHDFSAGNLRTTPWMHRRVDVDYNGWWMCLIPTAVIRETGYALPAFIKWDDAEFGLRAQEHGFRTVTLPGAAVWHAPWSEKDDTIDWQAYYHQRNRWVVTLSHTPVPRGGRMPFESFALDVRHLLSMQYSAVDVRVRALEDVLSGPDHLHATIAERLGWVRARRKQFTDAQVRSDVESFPPVLRGGGVSLEHEPNLVAESLLRAAKAVVRQFLPVRKEAQERPELAIPASDARWWRLAELDSALVSSSDGTGASLYRRDPRTFRSLLMRSIAAHVRLMSQWPEMSQAYRDALPRVVGREAWEDTFAAVSPAPEER
ncbi:glycosyltransferase [Sinomonas halotolerans]|uniref:Glycosyltransferase n=1 Tax=Sinomonas halotolerans TaxID=1644133 RepID=A0ABU9WWH9_9MICC